MTNMIVSRILATFSLALLAACGGTDNEPVAPPTAPSAPSESDAAASFAQHTKELRREVVKVGDNVHVAVGFAFGNSILVTGKTCAFVVDTTESRETGAFMRLFS